jgi:hypothetical protein
MGKAGTSNEVKENHDEEVESDKSKSSFKCIQGADEYRHCFKIENSGCECTVADQGTGESYLS